MSVFHVLVVEDEEDIQQVVEYNLLKAGYEVSCADSGEAALEMAMTDAPDMILLDLMLPGIDGLNVCRQLKNNRGTDTIPVVMLTAKGEESDLVRGLECGADDYIVKPFSPKVLLARMKAIRRRLASAPGDGKLIEVANLVIDVNRHRVFINETPIELTLTEFRLLQLLAGRRGLVFTRSQIVNAIRGEDYIVTDRAVDVQIVGLRKKLGETGALIETVRGVGYRFRD